MKISKREKGFLIVGGLAVLAYLGGVYVVEPFVASRTGLRAVIEENQALLERQELLASDRERYRRRAAALRSQLQQAGTRHFPGEKAPVVAAEIQGILHTFGQEAGVTIARQNVPPPKKVEMFTQVTVELSVRGEMRAIRDFIYRISTAPKMLTIPRLVIRGFPSQTTMPLSADLQVAGYMLGTEEKGAANSPPAVASASRAALENR